MSSDLPSRCRPDCMISDRLARENGFSGASAVASEEADAIREGDWWGLSGHMPGVLDQCLLPTKAGES